MESLGKEPDSYAAVLAEAIAFTSGIAVLSAIVWSAVHCWTQPLVPRHTRAAWLAAIVLLPVLGTFAYWLSLRRPKKRRSN